jgi:hypothetical protein
MTYASSLSARLTPGSIANHSSCHVPCGRFVDSRVGLEPTILRLRASGPPLAASIKLLDQKLDHARGFELALKPVENERLQIAGLLMELAGLEPATSWVRFHPGVLSFFVMRSDQRHHAGATGQAFAIGHLHL